MSKTFFYTQATFLGGGSVNLCKAYFIMRFPPSAHMERECVV